MKELNEEHELLEVNNLITVSHVLPGAVNLEVSGFGRPPEMFQKQ